MPVALTPVEAPRKQYPHVDDIADWRAQQSIRLLWDHIGNLEVRLQAAEATLAALVPANNSLEQADLDLQAVDTGLIFRITSLEEQVTELADRVTALEEAAPPGR